MTQTTELIRGRHAVLRLTEESDAEQMVAWRNDPDHSRWLIRWEPLTVESHLRFFRRARELGDLLVTFTDLEGTPIGSTSIYHFDRPRTSGEWGRLCGAQVGGGARMLEACYLLQRTCFEGLGMRRIWAEVAADNPRVWRLCQFLGYVDEGVRAEHWVGPHGHYDVRMIRAFRKDFETARPEVERRLYGTGEPPPLDEARASRIRAVFEDLTGP